MATSRVFLTGFFEFSANKYSWICEKLSKFVNKDLNKLGRKLKIVVKSDIIKNDNEFKT